MNFIETIRIADGVMHHLDLHLERIERTVRDLYPDDTRIVKACEDGLRAFASSPALQGINPSKVYKARLTYSPDLRFFPVQLEQYVVQPIDSLRLEPWDRSKDYSYKYEDRSALYVEDVPSNQIVLFLRDGKLTDTAYTNIVLEYRGGLMLTPSDPLLPGVMREHLIRTGIVYPAELTPQHLAEAERIHFINAMMPLGIAPSLAL